MDRIDAMKLFLRVADAGSFSRAAADLSIGQPTVSRRIQDLEHQLGAELFHHCRLQEPTSEDMSDGLAPASNGSWPLR